MYIVSLEIEHFGKLKNKKINLRSGLNVITGVNNSGKTTIAEFIQAMLFGLEENEAEYEKYYPLKFEGYYGGRLRMTFENENYTVERSFLPGNSSLKILKDRDRSEIENPEAWLFEVLGGISKEDFKKSAYMFQNSFENDIREYVTNIEKNTFEQKEAEIVNTYRSAMNALQEQKSGFEGQLTHGLTEDLRTVCNGIIENKKQISTIEAVLPDKKYELANAKDALSGAVAEAEKKDAETLGKLKERMIQKKEGLSVFSKKIKGKKNGQVLGTVIMTIGILTFIATWFESNAVGWTTSTDKAYKLMMVFFAVALLIFLCGLGLVIFRVFKNRKIEKLIENQKILKTEADKADNDYQYYLDHKEELRTKPENEDELKNIVKGLEEEILSLEETHEKCVKTVASLEEESRILSERMGKNEAIQGELNAISAALSSFDEILKRDSDYDYEISDKVNGYIKQLVSDSEIEVRISQNSVMSILIDGENRNFSVLSDSSVKAVFLAMRAALIEKYDPEKKLVVIADDIFAGIDNEHVKSGMNFIKALGRETIVFSCQEREQKTV